MGDGIPEYDELQVRFELDPGGVYHVRVFGAQGVTGSGAFTVPFSMIELDNFILRVGLPPRSMRSFSSSEMEEAKRFGAALFDALIRDDVREAYVRARQAANGDGRGLRLTFQLTDTPELMEIPWEFLYERPSFLSQSIYSPIARSLDLKTRRPPLRLTPPLRILGMVSNPRGVESLDVSGECRKLERALTTLTASGLVELRWLAKATLSELDRAVSAPEELHVIHYIGHGGYDDQAARGLVLFEDEYGNPQEVSGEELGAVLQDERSLGLAVLNACEGARTSHVDPFSGVASALVESGIPAVIGMQFKVSDAAAIAFADRLYFALSNGFPVDASLAQARRAIFAAGHDVEFGTPVLFLRTGETTLFEIDTSQLAAAPTEEGSSTAQAATPQSVGDHPQVTEEGQATQGVPLIPVEKVSESNGPPLDQAITSVVKTAPGVVVGAAVVLIFKEDAASQFAVGIAVLVIAVVARYIRRKRGAPVQAFVAWASLGLAAIAALVAALGPESWRSYAILVVGLLTALAVVAGEAFGNRADTLRAVSVAGLGAGIGWLGITSLQEPQRDWESVFLAAIYVIPGAALIVLGVTYVVGATRLRGYSLLAAGLPFVAIGAGDLDVDSVIFFLVGGATAGLGVAEFVQSNRIRGVTFIVLGVGLYNYAFARLDAANVFVATGIAIAGLATAAVGRGLVYLVGAHLIGVSALVIGGVASVVGGVVAFVVGENLLVIALCVGFGIDAAWSGVATLSGSDTARRLRAWGKRFTTGSNE